MQKAIDIAKQKDADLIIISDANTYYISEIIKHHKVEHYFMKILTNPAEFDGPKLTVKRFSEELHGCDSCSVHMCKGLVMF